MRITGGTHRSRKINAPKSLPIRPTTDYAKESLFNILYNIITIENAKVLDLFSGTGSISYEFASRGAKEIIAVEKNRICADYIKQQSTAFGFNNIMVWNTDVFIFLKKIKAQFDIIFVDPPYALDKISELPHHIFLNDILNKNGILIIEHSNSTSFSKEERFLERRTYGAVNFSIFK